MRYLLRVFRRFVKPAVTEAPVRLTTDGQLQAKTKDGEWHTFGEIDAAGNTKLRGRVTWTSGTFNGFKA